MLKHPMALNTDNEIAYKRIYVNYLKIKRWVKWNKFFDSPFCSKQSVLLKYVFPYPPHLLHLRGWEAEREWHHEAVEVGSWTEGTETVQLLILPPAHHHLRLRAHRKMPGFNILVKRRKNWAGADERNERVWTRQPRQGVTGRCNFLRKSFQEVFCKCGWEAANMKLKPQQIEQKEKEELSPWRQKGEGRLS